MFGLLMEGEVASAEKVLHKSEKPFTAIIGGAKVSDKILIIENLAGKSNRYYYRWRNGLYIFESKGGKIGNSLCEEDRLETAKEIMKKAKEKGVCIHLPPDSVIADKFEATCRYI